MYFKIFTCHLTLLAFYEGRLPCRHGNNNKHDGLCCEMVAVRLGLRTKITWLGFEKMLCLG